MRRFLAIASVVAVLALAFPFPSEGQQGIRGAATHTEVAVGAGSTLVLAASGGGGTGTVRKGINLVNASDQDIWCAFGTAAVVGKGYFLATSASVPHKQLNWYNIIPIQVLNCITASGGSGKNVAVTEWK